MIDLSKKTRSETQILRGQYDTDVNRHVAMRHDKSERERMSILIAHKQSSIREIDWIHEQKQIIDNFISKMTATLDKYLCDGPSKNSTYRTVR